MILGAYCFTLGSGMTLWSLKKQSTITDSTCAAKYMAALEAGQELVWLQTLLQELGYKPTKVTTLMCDNAVAVLLCADQSFHNCMKHLNICFHCIHECVDQGEILVGQIATIDNIVDAITNTLPGP